MEEGKMPEKHLYGFKENIFLIITALRFKNNDNHVWLCTEVYRNKDNELSDDPNAKDYWMHTVNEREYWNKVSKSLLNDLRSYKTLGKNENIGFIKESGKMLDITDGKHPSPSCKIAYLQFGIYKEEQDWMHISKSLIDSLRRWKKLGTEETLGPYIHDGKVEDHIIPVSGKRMRTVWMFGVYGPSEGKSLEEAINEYS